MYKEVERYETKENNVDYTIGGNTEKIIFKGTEVYVEGTDVLVASRRTIDTNGLASGNMVVEEYSFKPEGGACIQPLGYKSFNRERRNKGWFAAII